MAQTILRIDDCTPKRMDEVIRKCVELKAQIVSIGSISEEGGLQSIKCTGYVVLDGEFDFNRFFIPSVYIVN